MLRESTEGNYITVIAGETERRRERTEEEEGENEGWRGGGRKERNRVESREVREERV